MFDIKSPIFYIYKCQKRFTFRGVKNVMMALKILFLAVGFSLLIWVNSKIKAENNGDERIKHIVQLAGLGAWNLIMLTAGLKTLLSIFDIHLSFISTDATLTFPVLFVFSLVCYGISFLFHYVSKT